MPIHIPAFVGQQVDVFIKASTRAVATQSPTSGLTDLAGLNGKRPRNAVPQDAVER